MSLELWTANFLSYWLQLAAISILAGLLVRLAGVRFPAACWQGLLALFLLLPALEPWRAAPAGITSISAGAISGARVSVHSPAWALSIFWAAVASGIAARLVWLAAGYARLRSSLGRARRLDSHFTEVLGPWKDAISVEPAIYLSCEAGGPVTFGLIATTVLLPEPWLHLEPGPRGAILCHEFLHVRNRDWAFHMVEEIVRAIFWFHPAIWWLTGEIRLAREQAIDRAVVRLTGGRQPYIEALLMFAGVETDGGMAAAPAFSRRHHLTQRISSILEEVPMKKSRFITLLAAITLCLVAGGAFVIRTFPLLRGVHRVSEPGVVAPTVLYKIDPRYTQPARDAKIQGIVVISLEVHPDGKAHNMRIERSLDSGLDHNALDAVSAWRFQPGTKDGRPVAVSATIEVNYRLL